LNFKKIKLALPLAIGWGLWVIISVILFSKYPVETTRLEDFTLIDQTIFWTGILSSVAGTAITLLLDSKWREKKRLT